MTTPAERTKAVVDTRDFLEMLSNAEEVTIRGLVQSVFSGTTHRMSTWTYQRPRYKESGRIRPSSTLTNLQRALASFSCSRRGLTNRVSSEHDHAAPSKQSNK